MAHVLADLTDDEDMLELINVAHPRRSRKTYRNRENHFLKWNDGDFIKRFRLSKHGVRFLLDRINHLISSPTMRNEAVSAQDMVFVTLRFYATGSFLQVVGDFIGIDKSTASRIVYKVSRAIASLHNEFIKMPTTEGEKRIVSQQFYNICRFPKCIGALDCTHVKIISPGGDEPEVYRNRKGFFSFNVQAICNTRAQFENIVCRWPGSTHDSSIFNNSRIRANFENGVYNDYVLVGDSGYALRNFLITPLANPNTAAEHLFNESQIRTRNPIERSFGIWKRRFPILAFGIRLAVHKVEAIVISTAVLHNMARLLNDPLPEMNEEEALALQIVHNVNGIDRMQGEGANNAVRQQLIFEYFQNLL